VFYLMRAMLVVFASGSGYAIIDQIAGNGLGYLGLISGGIIAAIAMVFEGRVRKTPLKIVAGGALGLITGLVVANLLAYPLAFRYTGKSYLDIAIYLFTNCVIGYIGLSVGMKKGDEFEGFAAVMKALERQGTGKECADKPRAQGLVIDTSVIIDGRVAEVCETGFLCGTVVVPQFILQELQYIADSADPVKRTRGKRGLDVLKQIQGNKHVEVSISDRDYPGIKEVDSKLVALAKELGARILTNDANLNKVAELQGVTVLNINRLATAMKPVVLPGEVMHISVLKEGKEYGQGVGYLEDGTMVVIDNAREHLGKAIEVCITSVLQTTGGRMIFSKVKEDIKRPVAVHQ
jgi:uncharacterized protein YacL